MSGLVQRGVPVGAIFLQTEADSLTFRPCRHLGVMKFLLKNSLQQLVAKTCSKLLAKSFFIYYAEDFVDTNLLLQFRYHQRQEPGQALLLCRNISRQPDLPHWGKVILVTSDWQLCWYLARAKVVVLDHEYPGGWLAQFRPYLKIVQLWHGLPYKYISGNRHLLPQPDACFVSSSLWYNQQVFPALFNAQHYLALGYSRNDVFVTDAQDIDWCNTVPQAVLDEIQASTGPLWLYMPTYRDNESELQLELCRIETLCAQYQRSFVLKLHPFISRRLARQFAVEDEMHAVIPLPGFAHIYLYPSGMNIYPWLAHSEALITDYSSVVSDYLLHTGAIFLYQYDRATYKDARGAFLVADEYFTAGPVASDTTELCLLLAEFAEHGDRWQPIRQALRKQLQLTDTPAAPAILDHIRQLGSN
ncbi:CDP-glycerol glycerophosphotransferase family protein [Rheinheimera nanhaiensis]|uniref:CDP-glycerol glycerophosphotransferase family protein n=1 Tax=Rheinheimera nanhaiensis TaxID=1163621 RepID=UPI0011D21CBF|nr:CDP-glycerol glycerophosphotransferase family protein [Rheinheimera nanhaiensis]